MALLESTVSFISMARIFGHCLMNSTDTGGSNYFCTRCTGCQVPNGPSASNPGGGVGCRTCNYSAGLVPTANRNICECASPNATYDTTASACKCNAGYTGDGITCSVAPTCSTGNGPASSGDLTCANFPHSGCTQACVQQGRFGGTTCGGCLTQYGFSQDGELDLLVQTLTH